MAVILLDTSVLIDCLTGNAPLLPQILSGTWRGARELGLVHDGAI